MAAAFVDLVRKGELQAHVYVSGLEFVLGFALAAVVGVALGVAIGGSDVVRDVLEPWLSALYATPVVAFAPLFVVWMGIGPSSKVAVAFLLAVLPIIINTSVGIRTTDQNLVDVARSFAASRGQIFFKILIPTRWPSSSLASGSGWGGPSSAWWWRSSSGPEPASAT